MITRTRLSLLLLFVTAVLLTLLKVPLASTQGVTVVAATITEALPVADPNSELWQQATAVEVPLSAQITAKPTLLNSNIRAVDVRALHNDKQIAVLVEWQDESMDDSMVRVQDFRDAVALQFPLVQGQPFFCMGQQDGDVNIWHWKADWQADIAARQDMETAYPHMYVDGYTFADEEAGLAAGPDDYIDVNYLPATAAGNPMAAATHSSPVEDLIAGGFGSLTAQPATGQNVQGYGEWVESKWRVVFGRDLSSSEGDDVSFASDQVYAIAFAVWDGANNERNGQKSTSQWISLQLGGTAPTAEAAAEEAAAPAPQPGPAGARETEANALEGLPYLFIPMGLVLGLAVALGLAVLVIARLPGRRQ